MSWTEFMEVAWAFQQNATLYLSSKYLFKEGILEMTERRLLYKPTLHYNGKYSWKHFDIADTDAQNG